MEKKDNSVELLRVIACYLVICCHANAIVKNNTFGTFLWSNVWADGVGIFWIITGFFLFRKSPKIKIKNYIYNIFLPSCAVIFFYAIFFQWLIGEENFMFCLRNIKIDLKQIGEFILKGIIATPKSSEEYLKNCGFLWYSFSYFKVLVFALLYNKINIKYKNRKILIAAGVLIVLNDIWLLANKHNFISSVITLCAIIFFVLLGSQIYKNKKRINEKCIRQIFIGLIVNWIVRAGVQLLAESYGGDTEWYGRWNSIFGCINAVCISLLVLSISLSSKLIVQLGENTFLIYLLHVPVITYLLRYVSYEKFSIHNNLTNEVLFTLVYSAFIFLLLSFVLMCCKCVLGKKRL